MISPISGDKSIAASTERAGESSKNSRSEETTIAPSNAPELKTTEPLGTTVEVDKARQLYDLENQSPRVSGAQIATPEAARSLLDRILEQFSAMPEQAMKSQASAATAPLANLLQTAPT
jgi:phage gp37-like protein